KLETILVLYLRADRQEQLPGDLDVPFHRAADIEEQHHLHRIVPLGPELEIQIAAVRGLLDGALEIEFFRRPGAREFPQPAQRDLDVAGAELDRVVEIAELAFVPDLHSAETAVALLADAHALGVVAVGAIRRRSGGADP